MSGPAALVTVVVAVEALMTVVAFVPAPAFVASRFSVELDSC